MIPECRCGKHLYVSKREAEYTRNSREKPPRFESWQVPKWFQGKRQQRRNRPGKLRIYECPEGAGWHIASDHTERHDRHKEF